MAKTKFPKTQRGLKCGKPVDKLVRLKIIPTKNPPSTFEEFCSIIIGELEKLNKNVKQIKGIVSKTLPKEDVGEK